MIARQRMKYLKVVAMAALAVGLLPSESRAITAWARKYGVSCNVCHVSGYKLTRAGQKFLRGGHRMPGSEDKEGNLSDYLAMTAKIRNWGKKKEETGKVTDSRSSSEFHALSLYSGGPLDSGFSYFAEMYLNENEKKNPLENAEKTESDMGDWARTKLAEAYLQYTTPGDEIYWTARAGRIMPWLVHLHGGGARLDYSRPLPLTSTVGNNPYRPYARQFGVGTGVAVKDAFFEFGMVNGTGKHENTVEIGTDTHKDFYVTVDYSFGDQGSMLGLYYYNGEYPLDWFGQAKSPDRFNQFGVLGNYTYDTPWLKGALIGSYFKGQDKYIPTSGVAENKYKSASYLVEGQWYFRDGALAPYFRWEFVDPDTSAKDNGEKFGPVVGIHWKPLEHGRFVLEFSDYKTRKSATTRVRERDLTLEMQFMF
ncbi:MAG: hypothetical protein HY611_10495 [Elusimicrobia bacterium]|nr:hypothetical protein [Elusimicrobiota bacterium]